MPDSVENANQWHHTAGSSQEIKVQLRIRHEKDMKKGFHPVRWKPLKEAGLEGLEQKSLYLREKSAFDTIIDTIT